MAVFQCKMCAGNLNVNLNDTVCTCDCCGTTQTLPRLDDESKVDLYKKASDFRKRNDFDRAMDIYEKILDKDRTDAESYWSLVLCRYGIEYVVDPITGRRIPTVRRKQDTSVFADEDYEKTVKYATEEQKKVYEQEAKAIDEIQKRILATSEKEERTKDSVEELKNYKDSSEYSKKTGAPKGLIVFLILACFAMVALSFFIIFISDYVIEPYKIYNNAVELMENKEYQEAAVFFGSLESYKDSEKKSTECCIWAIQDYALDYLESGDYKSALAQINQYEKIDFGSEYQELIDYCREEFDKECEEVVDSAMQLYLDGKVEEAYDIYKVLVDYGASRDMLVEISQNYPQLILPQ